MPPTKISAIPTARVQCIDRISSASGRLCHSSKLIRSTSSPCLVVPSAAVNAVDCKDTVLVDDAMPCHLDRHMFQDSIFSVCQTHAIAHSTLLWS